MFDSHALSNQPVYHGHGVVLADDYGLQHIDSSAAEVDGQGQVPAEHVTLTFETPAPANAQYTELQNVGFAISLHVLLFSVYISYICINTNNFQFHNNFKLQFQVSIS